ncbi:hypothetical protein AGDE_13620 [Angomonas deanei]|uniref:Uncharacterized protein n=1 Tax=Angomonas deanei TaxID=59799 RepID=A0A7G2C6A9_9TRYP|nr:hypothetical protein AGDE_13620 [Angomonas deanei]CAD2215286.1 hypothetical protein, conserved [Angomonas deanei]|eukprot:EPY22057.1 hypothetical protein AGDE_13620 [Angomonas deanei]
MQNLGCYGSDGRTLWHDDREPSAHVSLARTRLEGLEEIEKVLDRHRRGRPHLPLHVVAELLYIKDGIEREHFVPDVPPRTVQPEERNPSQQRIVGGMQNEFTSVNPIWTDRDDDRVQPAKMNTTASSTNRKNAGTTVTTDIGPPNVLLYATYEI